MEVRPCFSRPQDVRHRRMDVKQVAYYQHHLLLRPHRQNPYHQIQFHLSQNLLPTQNALQLCFRLRPHFKRLQPAHRTRQQSQTHVLVAVNLRQRENHSKGLLCDWHFDDLLCWGGNLHEVSLWAVADCIRASGYVFESGLGQEHEPDTGWAYVVQLY
jgi:hypothetical protein